MAGQTRGSWRKSIPTPPVINLAWLKEWFGESVRKPPHAFYPVPKVREYRILGEIVHTTTKTKARMLACARLGINRLPRFTKVEEVKK